MLEVWGQWVGFRRRRIRIEGERGFLLGGVEEALIAVGTLVEVDRRRVDPLRKRGQQRERKRHSHDHAYAQQRRSCYFSAEADHPSCSCRIGAACSVLSIGAAMRRSAAFGGPVLTSCNLLQPLGRFGVPFAMAC